MNLYTSFYNEINIERKKELLFCIRKNISNKYLSNIYILCDSGYEELNELKENKLKIILIEKRPTFNDFILFVNKNNNAEMSIIANSDIYFDSTILIAKELLNKNEVFCLTRWDFNPQGKLNFYENFKSQDAWVFVGKLPENIGNYFMGLPGCDNRFAKELFDSEYNIKNPSLTIKAIHVHSSNLRNYHKTADRVIGEYAYPLPTELKNHKTQWGQLKEYELRLKYLHRIWRNDLEGVNHTLLERLSSRITSFYLKYLQK